MARQGQPATFRVMTQETFAARQPVPRGLSVLVTASAATDAVAASSASAASSAAASASFITPLTPSTPPFDFNDRDLRELLAIALARAREIGQVSTKRFWAGVVDKFAEACPTVGALSHTTILRKIREAKERRRNDRHAGIRSTVAKQELDRLLAAFDEVVVADFDATRAIRLTPWRDVKPEERGASATPLPALETVTVTTSATGGFGRRRVTAVVIPPTPPASSPVSQPEAAPSSPKVISREDVSRLHAEFLRLPWSPTPVPDEERMFFPGPPSPSSQLAAIEQPVVTQQPVILQQPVAIQQPAAIQQSVAIDQPFFKQQSPAIEQLITSLPPASSPRIAPRPPACAPPTALPPPASSPPVASRSRPVKRPRVVREPLPPRAPSTQATPAPCTAPTSSLQGATHAPVLPTRLRQLPLRSTERSPSQTPSPTLCEDVSSYAGSSATSVAPSAASDSSESESESELESESESESEPDTTPPPSSSVSRKRKHSDAVVETNPEAIVGPGVDKQTLLDCWKDVTSVQRTFNATVSGLAAGKMVGEVEMLGRRVALLESAAEGITATMGRIEGVLKLIVEKN